MGRRNVAGVKKVFFKGADEVGDEVVVWLIAVRDNMVFLGIRVYRGVVFDRACF